MTLKSKELRFDQLFTFLFLVFSATYTVSAQAKLSKAEFVEKCMQLATTDGRSGDEFSCRARTQKDAALLNSVDIEESFEIDISKAKVGSWGDGVNTYNAEVAFVIKGGFFGIGSKALRIACEETKNGDVLLRSKRLAVDIEERIDSRTTAEVICR